MKGAYCLLIRMRKGRRICIGRLGTFLFPKGIYVYTGSGMSDLEKRIERHKGEGKRRHWHIDYLLDFAEIEGEIAIPSPCKIECFVNSFVFGMRGARVIAPGFGSSDCSCPSHLAYFGSSALRIPAKVANHASPLMDEGTTTIRTDSNNIGKPSGIAKSVQGGSFLKGLSNLLAFFSFQISLQSLCYSIRTGENETSLSNKGGGASDPFQLLDYRLYFHSRPQG